MIIIEWLILQFLFNNRTCIKLICDQLRKTVNGELDIFSQTFGILHIRSVRRLKVPNQCRTTLWNVLICALEGQTPDNGTFDWLKLEWFQLNCSVNYISVMRNFTSTPINWRNTHFEQLSYHESHKHTRHHMPCYFCFSQFVFIFLSVCLCVETCMNM